MQVFTFYRENKLDNKYQLTIEEIKEELERWLEAHPKLKHYEHQLVVTNFVCKKDGLNSVADTPEDYAKISEAIKKPIEK